MVKQWALLPSTDRRLLGAVAAEVPLDPGLEKLLDGLRRAGAEVTVVSDGFGFHADEVCRSLGVRVVTNSVDWVTGQLRFPTPRASCPCSRCGTCKREPVEEAQRRGRVAMFVGDGVSDREVAPLVDILFAKGQLATWCQGLGVPFQRFSSRGRDGFPGLELKIVSRT